MELNTKIEDDIDGSSIPFEEAMAELQTLPAELSELIPAAMADLQRTVPLDTDNPFDGCSLAEKISTYLGYCQGEYGVRRLVDDFNKLVVLARSKGQIDKAVRIKPMTRVRLKKIMSNEIIANETEAELLSTAIFNNSLKPARPAKKKKS